MPDKTYAGNAPKYITVYNLIKTDILAGKFPTGSFLPTESVLMENFEASRTTIRKAIAMLKTDQLVNVQQGRGTEVIASGSSPTPFDLRKSMGFGNLQIRHEYKVDGEVHTTTQNSIVDIVQAEVKFASSLQVALGSNVYRLQRVKLINERIFAYSVSYVPFHVVPDLLAYSGKISNLYRFLNEQFGISVTHVEDRIGAVLAGFLESKLLNVGIGTPLLLFRRKAWENSNPIEYAETTISPEYFDLVLSMDRINRNVNDIQAGDFASDI